MYSIFLLLVLSFIPDHAIYISVVELKYDGENARSSISVKVFTDDLQNVIRNYSADFTQAPLETFVSKNQSEILSYFNEKLKFRINNAEESFQFVSSALENDAYFLNFEMSSPAEWKKLEIVGDYFSEVFPDQSNVITIKYDDKKYFARLTKSKPAYFISFE